MNIPCRKLFPTQIYLPLQLIIQQLWKLVNNHLLYIPRLRAWDTVPPIEIYGCGIVPILLKDGLRDL